MQQKTDYHSIVVKEITINDAIQVFLDKSLVTASPQTVTWYQKRLALFQCDYGEKYLSEFDESDLWVWYKKIQGKVRQGNHPVPGKISITTQHGYVRAVRRFFKWLYVEQLIFVDLAREIKLPKLPKNGKKGISDDNVDTLLKAAASNRRDYAMLRFIESTGCRRGGVADLRISDLSLDATEPLCRRAIVREKGNKERIVFMSFEALRAMREWLDERESESDFVFINTRKPDNGLAPSGISQIVSRYKDETGIIGQVSPHQWRHRLGRKMLEEGMPLGLLSQMLGHTSVVVTNDFYGMFAVDDLHKAVDRYYKSPKRNK